MKTKIPQNLKQKKLILEFLRKRSDDISLRIDTNPCGNDSDLFRYHIDCVRQSEIDCIISRINNDF